MKVIRKYEAGGFSYMQYTPRETPIAALSWAALALGNTANTSSAQTAASTGSTSANTKTSTSTSTKGNTGLLTNDMVKLLYENGLPNDVDAFLKNVDIFGDSIVQNPFSPSSSSVSSQEARYKLILSILPKLKTNKEHYDNAIKNAEKNGTIAETAISPDGRVFVTNKEGNVVKKYVALLESGENPLTVGELALMRAYSSSSAFDNDLIVTAINNSVSIGTVFKNILSIVDKIGKSTRGSEMYYRKDSAQAKVSEGLLDIIGSGDAGNYKIKSESTSQSNKATYALNYILETLPTNQRVLLQEYARKNGMDLKNGPLKIIQDCILGQLDDSFKTGVDYTKFDKESSSSKKKKDGEESEEDEYNNLKNALNFNQAMAMATGDTGQHLLLNITPGGNVAYLINALVYSYLQKAGGSGNVGAGKMSDALNDSQAGGIIDKTAIHAGNQRIEPALLERMYYSGTGAETMELPYTTDENGKIMPDWSLMDEYQAALKELANLGSGATQDQVNSIYKQHGLDAYYNSDGTLNRDKFMRFFAITAYGDEQTFKDPDDDTQTFTVIDNEGVENAVSTALGTEKKPLKLDGDLYKTVLYAPVYDSPTNAMMSGGTDIRIPQRSLQQLSDDEANMKEKKVDKTLITGNLI